MKYPIYTIVHMKLKIGSILKTRRIYSVTEKVNSSFFHRGTRRVTHLKFIIDDKLHFGNVTIKKKKSIETETL